MFHNVRLQPADSPKTLVALGLKLKRKKKQDLLLQPCPAFCGSHCSIYEHRPERCRLFECRQLTRIAAGEIDEAEALANIRGVQQKVDNITRLLDQAGITDAKRPLSKRCEKILAEPPEDPAAAELREEIRRAMDELDHVLDQDFRQPASSA